MKLIKFSVTNYKVFEKTFKIEFSKDSIVILTGRNNTGKSTILEAINCFFQKESKAKTIPSDCFSKRDKEIVLEAVFESDDENKITIVKKYRDGTTPRFLDENDIEIKNNHELKDTLSKILDNKPFYITPYMLPDDINELIQNIYSEIIKNDLEKLEDLNEDNELEKEMRELASEYNKIKKSYPEFLKKLKSNTDKILEQVSMDVTNHLQTLFGNDHLSLKVIGGETEGFSVNDILKSTNSRINVSSKNKPDMPLSNQGTGLQRMSLIYLIQNMIEKKMLGQNENKLLLIDEPEAFLHPEAVRALSRSLYKIGQRMPLMISTHSPILIDLSERHTSIQVFRVKEKEAIQLYKSTSDQFDEDDIKNMKILNYVDSYVNEFFFTDKIIIVEGDTEYIAFKHFAKRKNVNLHIIRARGKSTIRTLMKILNQFNADYDVLHDIDNDPKRSSSDLKKQLTNCKEIFKLKENRNVRIFCSIPNFEGAIGIGNISNAKKTQTIYKILHDEFDKEEFANARRIIENLFEQIINREEKDLDGGFRRICTCQDYDDLFKELISNCQEDEKENEETVGSYR